MKTKKKDDGYQHFRCEKCNRKLFVKKEWQGLLGKCPSCGAPVRIPYAEKS